MSRQGGQSIWTASVAVVMALAAVLLLVPSSAQARIGRLDPTFGERGRVAPDLKPNAAVLMAIGSDGSPVFANGSEVIRLLSTGEVDVRFGVGGRSSLPEEIEGLPFGPSDLALDSQGRIAVFGTLLDRDQQILEPDAPYEINLAASWAVVLRLRSDGQLDQSFGEGRGFLRSDFGLRAEESPNFNPVLPAARLSAGAVDSHDRPVVMLSSVGNDSPCAGHSGPAQFPRVLVRLTTAGGLDPGFGSGGVSPIWGKPSNSALGFAAGDLPVAQVGSEGCPRSPMVFRFDADGAPLEEFGASGVRAYSKLGWGLIKHTGGLILRSGRPTRRVIQISPNGARDRSFGTNGAAVVAMPPGARRTLRPVGVDAQGRVVLAGSLVLPKPGKGDRGRATKPKPSRGFLVVGRLRLDGELDRSFGRRGWMLTPVGRSIGVSASRASLDPQGRLVILGSVTRSRNSPDSLVLVRYLLGA